MRPLDSVYHVQIPVTDLTAAIKWYVDHLGFAETWPATDRHAFLGLPHGPFLMMWRTEDPERANFTIDGETFPVVLFGTRRIHDLRKNLMDAGVPITQFQDEGTHWILKFLDPDGNMLGVIQDSNQ